MGEYRDDRNIRCFHPDNTESTVYRANSGFLTLEDIIETAKDAFGGSIEMSDIRISAEHIQTSCLGYNGYDWSDWTNFIVIERL